MVGGNFKNAPSFTEIFNRHKEYPTQCIVHAIDKIHAAHRGAAKNFLQLIDATLLPQDLQRALGDFRQAVAKNYQGHKNQSEQMMKAANGLAGSSLEVLYAYKFSRKLLPVVLREADSEKKLVVKVSPLIFLQIFALGWSGTSQIDIGRMPNTITNFLKGTALTADSITTKNLAALI